MKKNKGFTLIELLVVIAIIAILSTVVMAGLNSARMKGRDAKRLADIKQVQSALELCYDTAGSYPAVATAGLLSTVLSAVSLPDACGTGIPFTNFMNPLPVNPIPALAAQTTYTYAGDTTTYSIVFGLEGQSGSLASGAHTATPTGIQ